MSISWDAYIFVLRQIYIRPRSDFTATSVVCSSFEVRGALLLQGAGLPNSSKTNAQSLTSWSPRNSVSGPGKGARLIAVSSLSPKVSSCGKGIMPGSIPVS